MNSQTSGSPTLAVVEQLAEKEGVDALELRPPLYDVVDTEALDQLVESMDEDGLVEFEYQDYQVTVSSSGEISVTEKAEI
ncbi:HalOD1 output domain-containing protein [Natrarchaeobius chitinivorans]|uniref:HalOD1 output domain-containing protein n=1 Tax=Natrarchaeobius chitinivorans TaxID=1679083 RepID=UPI00243690E4|nr:HalOD1 output domain-containing protein [Natrarchaeobius chitinivorans]